MYIVNRNSYGFYDILIEEWNNGKYMAQAVKTSLSIEEVPDWMKRHNMEIVRMQVQEKKEKEN